MKPRSFNKYLLSSYYVLGTLLSTDDFKMRKIKADPYLCIAAKVENTISCFKKKKKPHDYLLSSALETEETTKTSGKVIAGSDT